MKFDVYEYTSCGGRSYNEDSVGSQISGDSGIFVVADGLGGHALGEEASALAVEKLISMWEPSDPDMAGQIERNLEEANTRILELQKQRNALMKTTAAVLMLNEDKAVWANVGDSRVYFIHENRMYSVTEDHSVAYKKYKSGEITRDELATDEDQSCLLRNLGNDERHRPDVYSADVSVISGDSFFLCSDGAWEYLRDEEILIDFLKAEDARHWAELMLLRIMERIDGENDNLTLLTVIIS